MLRNCVVLSCLLAMLCSCATDKLIGRPDLKVVTNGELPPPTRQDQILQARSYLVGPYDKVSIDVYNVPDLSRTVQVDASGQIALPLIGNVNAAGKTPSELAAAIAAALRGRYVRDPQVTVNADTINQTITVDGSVEAPGLYPVLGKMTLMRAVASAKGVSQFAATNYVIVFRQVNDQQMAALYDLRAIRQGIYADPEVYANDVVFVGESGGRRVFASIIQSGALLTAPLVAILQRN